MPNKFWCLAQETGGPCKGSAAIKKFGIPRRCEKTCPSTAPLYAFVLGRVEILDVHADMASIVLDGSRLLLLQGRFREKRLEISKTWSTVTSSRSYLPLLCASAFDVEGDVAIHKRRPFAAASTIALPSSGLSSEASNNGRSTFSSDAAALPLGTNTEGMMD